MVPHYSNPHDCSCIYENTYFKVGLELHELVHDIHRVECARTGLRELDITALHRALELNLAEIGNSNHVAVWSKAWDFVESANRSVGARILNFIRHILNVLWP